MKDFFEKVREKVDEGISTLSSKSREAIDMVKLRSHLRELERGKEEKINELGTLVYDLLRRDVYQEQEVREAYQHIVLLDHQIVSVQDEIRKAQAASTTVSALSCDCGAAVGPDQKFCSSCGKDVQGIIAGAKPTEGSKRCATCGSEIKEEAKFCPKCGTKQ